MSGVGFRRRAPLIGVALGSLLLAGCAAPEGAEPLADLEIVSIDGEMPALPQTDEPADSYALPGPGPNDLTLVISGNGCASRPVSYLTDAPAGSLEIVSEVIVPAGAGGCTEPLIPWTTVVAVPEGFRDYRSVKVDNLETVLLD